MAFKLVSKAIVYASQTGAPREPHEILAREKTLYPGTSLYAKGIVSVDAEEKTGVEGAVVTIKVLDNSSLAVDWKPDWRSRWPFSSCGYYGSRILRGGDEVKDPFLLVGAFQRVNMETLPSAFTLLDKLLLIKLARVKMNELKERYELCRDMYYFTEWKTNIRYEPTLPPQSRK